MRLDRSVRRALASPGTPLDSATRAYFEPELGHDFNSVRVHADSAAAESAHAINALAYTVGRHVVFGRGRYAPTTLQGQQLLAHELAHVVQQGGDGAFAAAGPLPIDGDPSSALERTAEDASTSAIAHRTPRLDRQLASQQVQRQVEKPGIDLAPRLPTMTDQELQDRYDWIVDHFLRATQSTLGDDKLQSEAGEIGAILANRAGRTFDAADIARMRKFFEANAKAPQPKSCIATLNEGVKLVLSEPKQKTAGSVDETAARLQQGGHAGNVREVGFLDRRGRPTTGTVSPVQLARKRVGRGSRAGRGRSRLERLRDEPYGWLPQRHAVSRQH